MVAYRKTSTGEDDNDDRERKNGHRVGTELLMGDSQDESTIDPSREGDEDTLEISDDF